MKMRKEPKMYSVVCDNIISLVVGKHVWRNKSWNTKMSELVTVSDEAFALLLLENSWDSWLHLASKEEHDETVVKLLYTVNGAGTRKNHGWKKEGLLRYVELINIVRNDCAADKGAFDKFFMEEKVNGGKGTGIKGKKRTFDYGEDLLDMMPYGKEVV